MLPSHFRKNSPLLLSDRPGLPSVRILPSWFSQNSPSHWCFHLNLILAINPHLSLDTLKLSLVLSWGLFPLLQSFLNKTCFYHFNYHLALVFFDSIYNCSSQNKRSTGLPLLQTFLPLFQSNPRFKSSGFNDPLCKREEPEILESSPRLK